MSALVIVGQVVLLLALVIMFLVNLVMFFVLIKNLGWLWRAKREDLKDMGDYVAQQVVDKMTGESK